VQAVIAWRAGHRQSPLTTAQLVQQVLWTAVLGAIAIVRRRQKAPLLSPAQRLLFARLAAVAALGFALSLGPMLPQLTKGPPFVMPLWAVVAGRIGTVALLLAMGALEGGATAPRRAPEARPSPCGSSALRRSGSGWRATFSAATE
jgi:hypothetical protein